MLDKEKRTFDMYKQVGADFRLFKTIGSSLVSELSDIATEEDVSAIRHVLETVNCICSNTEEQMHSDGFRLRVAHHMFFGSTEAEYRHKNEIDLEVLQQVAKSARKYGGTEKPLRWDGFNSPLYILGPNTTLDALESEVENAVDNGYVYFPIQGDNETAQALFNKYSFNKYSDSRLCNSQQVRYHKPFYIHKIPDHRFYIFKVCFNVDFSDVLKQDRGLRHAIYRERSILDTTLHRVWMMAGMDIYNEYNPFFDNEYVRLLYHSTASNIRRSDYVIVWNRVKRRSWPSKPTTSRSV